MLKLAIKPTLCVMYKYMAILHTVLLCQQCMTRSTCCLYCIAWTVTISGLDTLLWFLLRVEHGKILPVCKNGSVPLHSRGHTNSDYVHILHASNAATTQNQTGLPPQSVQRNLLPYHQVSRRKSQCTRRYTGISLLIAWEIFATFTAVR